MHEITHPPLTREPIDGAKYGGQWIAILRRRIVDHDADLDALCDRLEEAGIEEQATLMMVPRPGTVLA